MVLNLILVGLGMVGIAAANGVTKTVKDEMAIKKAKKAEQLQQVEEATAVPAGYAPQRALLGNYHLISNLGETLIATFRFAPCEWTKKDLFGGKTSYPRCLDAFLGIGHITSHRILLFYDLKKTTIADKAGRLRGM
jgi:hypothetical protein